MGIYTIWTINGFSLKILNLPSHFALEQQLEEIHSQSVQSIQNQPFRFVQVCYKTLPFFSIIDPIWSLGRFTLEIPWFPRLNLRCSLKFSHHPNLKNQHLKIGGGCEEHNESCVILSTLETNFTKIFDENFIFLVWTSSQLFRLASLIGKWNRIYFIIFRFFLKLNT